MDHPNAAKALDAGTDKFDRPYFVMEYVPGVSITQYASDNRLTVYQRLELFTQACDAIAHAHMKALIHSDIKPSNVLAYTTDGGNSVEIRRQLWQKNGTPVEVAVPKDIAPSSGVRNADILVVLPKVFDPAISCCH